jgi:hypothetical protein
MEGACKVERASFCSANAPSTSLHRLLKVVKKI